MKRLITLGAIVTMILAVAGAAMADTIIELDPVQLRDGDVTGQFGTITEYANGNGVSVQTTEAGQKVYYGTDYFGDVALSGLDYIEFTYRTGEGGSTPYTNVVITDGTNQGIIYAAPTELWSTTDGNGVTARVRCVYANNSSGFRFFEPSPDSAPYSHGQTIYWSDVATWDILDTATTPRSLSSGEAGEARGPVDHGIAILWGDSAANYLGSREIFDVAIYSNGEAHVPEPATMSLLALGGIALLRRRRK